MNMSVGCPRNAEFWPPRYDRTMETESKSHRDMESESQRVQESKNQRSREPEGQRVKESESQRVGESERHNNISRPIPNSASTCSRCCKTVLYQHNETYDVVQSTNDENTEK
jgi:hypothetical protein